MSVQTTSNLDTPLHPQAVFSFIPQNFHLSVDQSLIVLTKLQCGTVIEVLKPWTFYLDPDLATWSAISSSYARARAIIQVILTPFCLPN